MAMILCFIFITMMVTTHKAINAQYSPSYVWHSCDNNKGNYTTNSTYQANLHYLLSFLPSNTDINYGVYNFSYGQNYHKVYAIGLCRGDVKPDACRSFLSISASSITQRCPNQKEAIEWYHLCMLRYSNRFLFSTMETEPRIFLMNVLDVSEDFDGFNRAVVTLLDTLRNEAAGGDSLRKYAAGNATAPTLQSLYADVQCTPDLSQKDCMDCLDDAFRGISECCLGKIGARSLAPSCNIRYENQIFFEPTDDDDDALQASPPSSSTTTKRGNKSNVPQTVIIVVVPPVGCVLVIISVCVYMRVRKENEKVEIAEEDTESEESLQYNFGTIRVATENFSDANKLGQGGFGVVYRGKLNNGQEIAVKRLSQNSGQGDLEFKNEVLLVARLQHRNLVKLLGFCLEGNERLLVYEFLPNASLDYFIFDQGKRANLDWDMRFKIIRAIAGGLIYLHTDSQLRIIHRDLKASNVLLDAEMNAKISDFGMAKLFLDDQTQGITNRIVGTYGYMAPEYAMNGKFSVKSDVFSFGVLLLEIISGQKNNCFRHGENAEFLLSYAWTSWRTGTASNLVDGWLRGGSTAEIMRCIHIGLLCVQENVTDRLTMNSVVIMLSSNSLTLPAPSTPAFFMHGSIASNMPRASDHNSRVRELDDQSNNRSIVVQVSTKGALITDLFHR